MKRLFASVVYTALLLSANGAAAEMSTISDIRDGDMMKLNIHAEAKEVSAKAYVKEDGSEGFLADHKGKVVLLNFWATWCAPCRHEMPMLSELQTTLGGDDFEVVTLATGRNALPGMKKFFDDIDVDNLPLHKDPKQAIARDMGVLGLPITVVLNKEGHEIARLRGDADWSSETAQAILKAIIEEQGKT